MEIEKENKKESDLAKEKTSNSRLEMSWSEEIKKQAIEKLQFMKIAEVAKEFGERIPRQTLSDWKKRESPKRKKGSGAKPKYPLVEYHLYDWFLTARARKIPIHDLLLLNKAKKIALHNQIPNFNPTIDEFQNSKQDIRLL